MLLRDYHIDKERYAKCIEVSKRVRWDIDIDVIRGREFDFSQKFLPDGISKVDQLDSLNDDEKRLLSQIQGCGEMGCGVGITALREPNPSGQLVRHGPFRRARAG